MVNQNKIFSFKIKCQAKNIFPSDVERTTYFKKQPYKKQNLGKEKYQIKCSKF